MGRSCPFVQPYVLFARIMSVFLIFVVSHFGFEGGTVVLIAPVPVHCFPMERLFKIIHLFESACVTIKLCVNHIVFLRDGISKCSTS